MCSLRLTTVNSKSLCQSSHLYFIIQIQNSIQHCHVAVEFGLYLIDIAVSTTCLSSIL